MIEYHLDESHILTLTLNMPGKSANLLGQELLHAFEPLLARIQGEELVRGVIITSAKKDFVAGADLDMLYQTADPEVFMTMGMAFKAQVRQLETMGIPLVAAINGTALGGGYEIALFCHHRIAVDDPKIRIGLPEVKLGLFPGGGGSQRLPRMIGIQNALNIILEGKELPPQAALKAGLVDELVPDQDALLPAARAWIAAHPKALQPWDQPDYRWPGGNPKGPAMMQLWSIAPSMLNQKTRGNYPAQQHALAAVYEGSQVDFDTAERIETRYFAKTASSQVAKNMISAFWYQLNAIKKGNSRPQNFPQARCQKVGILGAGMMGAGIAYVAARAGLQVVLKDVDPATADKGKDHSVRLLDKQVNRGRLEESERAAILGRIQPTAKVEDLADCELIVEAVFEDRELKAKVTRETEQVIAANAIFASNTSTLPITGLAARSARPGQFIGLHFFSPVDRMNLVAIIIGGETTAETLAKAFDFVLQIRKTPIVVNDSRGFYTSRVFSTYVMEGLTMLREGVIPRAIESAGLQAGMPVGPLALSDEVSLSLMHHIMNQTRKDMEAEGKTHATHPGDAVVVKMVEDLDRQGKKQGKGFYDYPQGAPKRLWPGLGETFPATADQPNQQEMIDRFLFVQALETVRCLDEDVLTSVADANIGSILGWGFAPFHGGCLQFINAYGLRSFVERTRELANTYGTRFSPPPSLVERAAADETYV